MDFGYGLLNQAKNYGEEKVKACFDCEALKALTFLISIFALLK